MKKETPPSPAEHRLAVVNGHVITPAGVIRDGLVLTRGSRIEYAGPMKNFVTHGLEIIDAHGGFVSPGLVDAHTHLGVYAEGGGPMTEDGNEMVDPITPHVRAIDSIDHTDKAFEEARMGGVTCAMITPGSANVIGGAACAVKTFGRLADEMVIAPNVGIKMAMGENPKRVYGGAQKAPMTRMGIAALLRQTLVAAQNYRDKLRHSKGKKEPAARDLKMEALLPVLDGTLPARIHAHRADDIMTALRVADEFGLKVVIEHATEAYKIADILAKRKVPVNIGPTTTGRSKEELRNLIRDNAVRCIQAGCMVSLVTDHPIIPVQELREEAVKVARKLRPNLDAVLATITINPARTLGLAHRLGALERGKDADIVVFTAYPVEPQAEAKVTIINGAVVWRAEGRE